MTTLSTTTTVMQPTMHSKFNQNHIDGLISELQKAGVYKKQQNESRRGHYEQIPTSKLVPLDTQRNVTKNWIIKVLKLSEGFDWISMGLIFVARDTKTGINYVWDGCGRLALAQANEIAALDCWVLEMDQAEAAGYFVRVQKTTKRSLDSAVHFCNAYAHGEKEALAMAKTLSILGMRIQGADDVWVPVIPKEDLVDYPQVKLRGIEQAIKYANRRGPKEVEALSNNDLIRFARDIIVQAGWNDDLIRQDLLPGLVIFYSVYPEAMKNGLNKMIRAWFQGLAQTVKQSKLTFKHSGGNQHNREAESVALGIVKELHGSPKCNANHKMILIQKRMKAYLEHLAGDTDLTDDDEV